MSIEDGLTVRLLRLGCGDRRRMGLLLSRLASLAPVPPLRSIRSRPSGPWLLTGRTDHARFESEPGSTGQSADLRSLHPQVVCDVFDVLVELGTTRLTKGRSPVPPKDQSIVVIIGLDDDLEALRWRLAVVQIHTTMSTLGQRRRERARSQRRSAGDGQWYADGRITSDSDGSMDKMLSIHSGSP